jgi:hypothetical protein
MSASIIRPNKHAYWAELDAETSTLDYRSPATGRRPSAVMARRLGHLRHFDGPVVTFFRVCAPVIQSNSVIFLNK